MTKGGAVFQRNPAYKDSGVEWIGEIPEHWEIMKCKYLFHEADERSLDGKEELLSVSHMTGVTPRSEKDVNMFLAENYTGSKLCENGDLVFNIMWAWMGALGVAKQAGIVSPSYGVYRQNNPDKFNSTFLEGLLKSNKYIEHYNRVSTGLHSSRLRFYSNMFFNMKLVFPPRKEQNDIVNFLDEKCSKIDLAVAQKEKMVALLKERKLIMIQHAVTKGLDPNVKMKGSGVEWIGEIPEHWEVVRNFQLFGERNEPGNEYLPILSVSIHTAVSSEELNDDDNIRGKIRIEDKSSYKLVNKNDIVYNMMRAWQGGIGSVSVQGMVSPAYVVAEPKGSFCSMFFEFQYRTAIFIQQMDRFSKGITDFRKRLYWDQFKQLKTIMPPVPEQKAIVDYIEKESCKIDKAIALQQKQIEKLKEYKATLINSAVTGKIKVA